MSLLDLFGIIKETENILVKDSRFHLPGKKSLLKEGNHFEAVLIDVTESLLSALKKTAPKLFREEEAAHPENPDSR